MSAVAQLSARGEWKNRSFSDVRRPRPVARFRAWSMCPAKPKKGNRGSDRSNSEALQAKALRLLVRPWHAPSPQNPWHNSCLSMTEKYITCTVAKGPGSISSCRRQPSLCLNAEIARDPQATCGSTSRSRYIGGPACITGRVQRTDRPYENKLLARRPTLGCTSNSTLLWAVCGSPIRLVSEVYRS